MYFDLAEITDLIAGMPDTYHKLSDPTRCLSLSLLTFARDRWRWRSDGDKLDDSQWDTALDMVDDAIRELIQTMLSGMVLLWTTNDIPDGFLLCDGAAVSRTDYAQLFNVLGTIYGNGDGTTTFNLPDLTGRVAVGRDASQGEFSGLNQSGGETDVSLNMNEMPRHRHSEVTAIDVPVIFGELLPGTAAVAASGSTSFEGNGNAHNNLQPYRVLNYIIKT